MFPGSPHSWHLLPLAAKGNKCQQCGDPGNTWDNVLQIDHILPLRDFGDNDQEYNVLCHQCHGHKSYLEALTPFQENPLASVFEPSVFESFVESPKAKQAVQQLHVPKTQKPTEIDVRRCRRSALEQNQHPLPVFSPLDEVKPCDHELGDYNSVSKEVTWTSANYAQMMPYTGTRWYWRGSVEYMLENHIITWENVTHTLTATAHL